MPRSNLDHLEPADVAACGCWAAEDILRRAYRVDIHKALDPLDPDDFITLVGRLRRSISRATERTEADILRKALDALDVDWPNLTARQRDRVVNAARSVISTVPGRIIPDVQQVTTVHGSRMIRGTRKSLRARLETRIGLSLSLLDQRILDHAVSAQALFVRDEYGRRVEDFSRIARGIVSDGLEQGLGRDEITDALTDRFGTVAGIQRSRNYWDVISATFMNRSRIWANLAGMDEAGITEYVFEAVMDERTTDQCALLHGRTFSVGEGINRYQQTAAAEDPEAVKDIQPWVRVGRDPEGNRILFTQARDGTRTHIANVVESRVGTRDFAGRFSNSRSTSELQAMGVSMPPLHGRCRSTIVANV